MLGARGVWSARATSKIKVQIKEHLCFDAAVEDAEGRGGEASPRHGQARGRRRRRKQAFALRTRAREGERREGKGGWVSRRQLHTYNCTKTNTTKARSTRTAVLTA